ncbi:MAG: hypothetical protein WA958_17275 [Tunicatimonas sp.]
MPALVDDIEEIASINSQSERCHSDTRGYLKITESVVKDYLVEQKGYAATSFGQGTLNNVLTRCGYTLKKVRKSLPLKRVAQTDTIFENIAQHRARNMPGVLKLSIDVKDKVKVGRLSRKGYCRSRQAVQALDKDQHWDSCLVPLGILQIQTGQSTVVLGNSHETSDFIVDGLEKWYELHRGQLINYHTLELYLDNGPAVASNRTQFINRMMEFACITGLKIHLLYYPPYHSNRVAGRYNPIERVWAALENYWNGTLLSSVNKVINTIKNITWKKVTPLVVFIDKVYQKGVKLSKQQMQQREQYLDRNQQLPKWDVWIRPSLYMGRLFLQ